MGWEEGARRGPGLAPGGMACAKWRPTQPACQPRWQGVLAGPHSLGAAGVQEAIYSLLMMQHGFIAESANITELDPEFADINIVRKRQDNVSLGAVLSNSFGFGGTNASLVFKHPDA